MGSLVRDDRKATVTQITTRYNQGMQNTISKCTTRRTLKQMSYSLPLGCGGTKDLHHGCFADKSAGTV